MAGINLFVFMGWQMVVQGLPVYIAQLGANSIQVGLVTTLAIVAAVIVRPFIGALVDRFGRKGFLIFGFGTMALITACYAVFPLVGVILALRVLHGVCWGVGGTANATLAADTIPRQRFAEGMGYFGMTNSLAMALGPVVAIWLLDIGRADLMIYVAAGFTLLAVGCAIFFFAKDYKQPALKTDGTLRDAFRLKNMFERTSVFPSITMGIMSMGFGAVQTFVVLLAAERGVTGVSIYFVTYAITNVVTRPVSGRLVDQRGYLGAGVFSCLAFACAILATAFCASLLTFGAAGILVGLGMGTGMSVFNSMAVAAAPPRSRGAATSTFLSCFNGGLGIGSLVAGFLAEAGGYQFAFLVMAVFPVLACIFFLCGGKKRIDSYHVRQHAPRDEQA